MAVVKISGEVELEAYFKTFSDLIPGLKAVIYVDMDADMDDLVGNYFRNKYKGAVLFVGLVESPINFRPDLTFIHNLSALSILQKYDEKQPGTLSSVRNSTKEMLVKCLHKIDKDFTESQYDAAREAEDCWTYSLPEGVLFPIGNMGGASCRGWFVEMNIGWPMSTVRI